MQALGNRVRALQGLQVPWYPAEVRREELGPRLQVDEAHGPWIPYPQRGPE